MITHSGVAPHQRLITSKRRVTTLRPNLALCHLERIVDNEDELDIVPAGLDAPDIGGRGGRFILGIAVRVACAFRELEGGRGRGPLLSEEHGGKVRAGLVADGESRGCDC